MNDNYEQHSYENGSTEPPKNRRWLITLIFCAGIIVTGVLTATGVWNPLETPLVDSPILFSESTDPAPTAQATAPADFVPGDVQIQLEPIPEEVDNVPQPGGMGLQDIYDKNIPSVVSISCTFSGGSGSGTGVVLSRSGYLVTNAHVVSGARNIEVLLTDGRTFSARLVGEDSLSDLAVLHIAAEDLTPAEFGDSGQLRVGDAVVAIGDPLGSAFRGTMTDGIVSAINRNVESAGRTMTLIQTNAALNSGNSGGPLINCFGQVIGINTMKIGIFADSAGVEGLGFAIPSAVVRDVANQLIAQGYVSGRPVLNISVEEVPAFDQHFYGKPAGLYVTDAPEDSELLTGDIITAVNSTRVKNEDELSKVLYSMKAGQTVVLTVIRGGKQLTVNVTLGESGR